MISEPFFVDRDPPYFVLGGIVFQELNRAILREWGKDWKTTAPQRLVFLDEFQHELPPDRGKIVFISHILPSDATIGYEFVGNPVVTSMNGTDIRSLADLAAAAQKPVDGFHRIEINEDPRLIILDAEEVENAAQGLMESYGMPSMHSIDQPTDR